MTVSSSAIAGHIKDVNERYHDVAAAEYDAKWGIDFGAIAKDQVRRRFAKALGGWPAVPFRDALEIGSGTGYLSLNLHQVGLIGRLTATDISQGMLDQLAGTAKRLGIAVECVRTEAEELPFGEASFDLVLGHAVLHHIPDLDRAFGEMRRVLRPGGTLAFCGEPSRYGDRMARVPKRGALLAAPLWRKLIGARPSGDSPQNATDGHEFEGEVDVHAFAPRDLQRMLERAGFERIHLRGEELLASAYGWTLRTLERTAEPDTVPERWRWFAFRSYLAFQRLDERVLEPRLPPQLFYNLVLSARKPSW